MADTRTERGARTARTVANAQIMSVAQMGTLTTWLETQQAAVPKVIATPSILLPRHARTLQRGSGVSALRSDGWDGYPESLYGLLRFIAVRRVPNVVFVSGDEHLACVARIELETQGQAPVVVHSVHCSPLFAPFPFANSECADLVADEDFTIPPPPGDGSDAKAVGPLLCRVRTEFGPPGDGFGVLRIRGDADNGWTMECAFDRAKGSATIVRKLA